MLFRSVRTFVIQLTDVDEWDVGGISDVDSGTNRIAENAVNGTVVGITAFAEDHDRTNNDVTYSLDENAGSRFSINGMTGIVTVADGGRLNYEDATSHTIVVRATSSDGSFATQSFTIAIVDVDEFDVSNVQDVNSSPDVVAENSANGTVVGITA